MSRYNPRILYNKHYKMLPQFPKFDKLELKHRQEIEKITTLFPPYSDYNFTSIWSYNVEGEMEVSTLNGNLVLSFQDYITSEPFHSFLGKYKVKDTINTLLDYVQTYMKKPFLKLIPEIVISADPTIYSHFQIEEDIDNHDYVVLIDELSNTKGKKNSDKRREINKLHRLHVGITYRTLNLSDKKIHDELIKVFLIWSQQKKLQQSDMVHEYTAMQRLLNDIPAKQLVCIGVYKQERLIAFTISEIINQDYAIGHFMKADTSYDGVYEYMRTLTAKCMGSCGSRFLNCEQDLGKPGLRQSKQAMKPAYFLKKYIISPKK